jgi:lipopolysaccharide/colanic/teichoic acid biosynthesis glycosyltransferase
MSDTHPLTARQRFCKRALDLVVAVLFLAFTWWVIVIAVLLATIDTGQFGLFRQMRVGRGGRLFHVCKVRTMAPVAGASPTTVTSRSDVRITRLGAFWRRWKIDEFPQMWNVIKGDMSLVGPRPDVPGYADALRGEDCLILAVRPGITGPATLQFRHEELMLESVPDPETFNREVLFPRKVEINLRYLREYSLRSDLRCLVRTLSPHRSEHDDALRDST